MDARVVIARFQGLAHKFKTGVIEWETPMVLAERHIFLYERPVFESRHAFLS